MIIKKFENFNEMSKFDNTIEVDFGTDFISEVDKTLSSLANHGLVLSVFKKEGVDCIKYTITFLNAEGAFMFGRTRPQLKGI